MADVIPGSDEDTTLNVDPSLKSSPLPPNDLNIRPEGEMPDMKYGTDKGQVPSQMIVGGRLIKDVTPEQAARLTGRVEPPITEGPNAKEADEWLTRKRIDAGTKPGVPLPGYMTTMAQARARGYSWDEIDKRMADVYQGALDRGYTRDEVNMKFLGAPVDNHPTEVKAPSPDKYEHPGPDFGGIPTKDMREFSERWLGPHNPFQTQGLPTPGGDYVAGGLLKRLGWAAWDFGKTFPAAIINGAAATAEMFDFSKSRNPYEWMTLAYESANFLAMMRSVPKGGKLPTHQEFTDAATTLAGKHPEGLTPANIDQSLKTLGEHYAATGEHPITAAEKSPEMLQRLDSARKYAADETLSPVERQAHQRTVEELEAKAKLADDPAVRAEAQIAAEDRAAPGGKPPTEPPKPPGGPGEPPPPEGPYIQPETLFTRNEFLSDNLFHNVVAALTPYSLAPKAGDAIAARLARSAIDTDRSVDVLMRYGRALGNLSTQARFTFMHAIETGQLGAYEGTPLGGLAKALRGELDKAHAAMVERGIAPAYVENYLKHMYKNPEAAGAWLSKRTIAGDKSFTRERIFGSYADAMEAGLQPATDNPILLSAIAVRQMNKFIAAHDIVTDFRNAGQIVTIAPAGSAPHDFVPINGKLGVTGEGMLYAPKDVARLINNITDPGLAQYSLYRTVRSASNTLISTQLGLSAYHATFITLDTFKSQVALAAQQFSSLKGMEMARAPFTLAKSIIAPVSNFVEGRQAIKYLKDDQANVSPEIKKLANALVEGGFRTGMTEELRGSAHGDFVNAFKGTFAPSTGYATLPQEVGQIFRDATPLKVGETTLVPAFGKAIFQTLSRTMDTLAAPIMGVYVPAMKAGVGMNLMREAIRLNPTMSEIELRHVSNLIGKSLDNRMGEMVYDNRFWNKTARDVAHLSVRALGWNIGDIAELGGGVTDFGEMLYKGRQLKIGDTKMITYRASYVIGEAVSTLLLGATTGYLAGTWSPDWNLSDYIFPPTKPDGQGRISFPSYAKEVYAWSDHTIETAKNKINPIWPMIMNAATNREWNGAAIADPNEDLLSNAGDYAKWFARTFIPISIKQFTSPTPAQEEIPWEFRALGLNAAPYDVREPGKAAKFGGREERGALRKRARQQE